MFKCIIVEKDLVYPHNGVVSCYKIKEDFYELTRNDFQAKLLSEMSKMQRDICMMLFLCKQRESMYIHAYTHGKVNQKLMRSVTCRSEWGEEWRAGATKRG